jgi:hypothetical protein
MSAALRFGAAAFQNEYLADGGDRVDVVVRVDADGPGGGPARQPALAAEFVILLDCSGSMSDPPTKLSGARRAAVAALDTLRDGVAFAVVAGNERARLVYPESGLVAASDETRAAAAAAVARLRASGGTAIGRWLTMAEELFSRRDGVVRHAILLTDGKNQHETPEELDRALEACRDRFRCDCRATGEGGGEQGWSGAELLRISQALAGTVQNIEAHADLPANFGRAAAVAMEHAVADLRLRVRLAEGSEVRFLKQVHPTINDLTARGVEVDARTRDYPTGAWGAERRDYQMAFTVAPRPSGTELRIAWVSLLPAGSHPAAEVSEVPIWARWTRDVRESTRINPQVAHYTGQTELAEAIQEGVEAYKQQRLDVARETLGRAVALAYRSQHADQLTHLARLVEIEDPARGLVRLRADVDPTGMESAVLDSVRTNGFGGQARPEPPPVAVPAGRLGELCPICHSPRVDRYCEQDGYDFARGRPAEG